MDIPGAGYIAVRAHRRIDIRYLKTSKLSNYTHLTNSPFKNGT